MSNNYNSKLLFIILILFLSLKSNSQTTKAISDGNWSSPSTWDNGVPNSNVRAIISKSFKVILDDTNHLAKELVVHGILIASETGVENRSLTTRWIHVNSGGIFRIGNRNNPFDNINFTITLTGTDPNSNQTVPMANGLDMTITKNDGFLMAAGGGRLQFFGKKKLSFTKLSTTAEIGSSSITVAGIIDRDHDGVLSSEIDGSFNWEVGDEIVIASSSVDYKEEEVRIITAIQNQGENYLLTLNEPLTYRHYGNIETYGLNIDPRSTAPLNGPRAIDMRAEVALLSRNVKIQGLESQDTDRFFGDRENLIIGSDNKAKNGVGGHIMIMPSAGQITVEGVQLNLMGQSGNLGRYPFHWHIARDRTGDIFKNSSITNSNNRAVVVHTTDNVTIEGIVAHDIHGHCFFTEDGVEINNKFINNIAFGIHRVAKNANKGEAFIVDNTDRFFDRGDRSRTTSAFWIANANNTYTGNVVAGSQGSGYWFSQHYRPRGAAANIPEYDNYEPLAIPVLDFNHNSAHSTITGFVIAGPTPPAGISIGEFGEKIKHFGDIDPLFNNLTIYQNRVGLYPLVSNITSTFNGLRAADNHVTNHDSDPTLIKNALMVGRSVGNPYTDDPVIGNRLYHGNTTIENTHIAGYGSSSFWFIWAGNRVRSGAETEKLTYENDNSIASMIKGSPSNYATVRDIYDRDGTLTSFFGGGPGFSLIPNNQWCKDPSLGVDVSPPASGQWRWVVSKQRFATLQSNRTNGRTDPFENPEVLVTSPHGVVRNFEVGNNNEIERDRFGVRFNYDNEYLFEFPNGIDFNTERFRLTLSQWALPSNSVGIVMRLKNMAAVLRAKDDSTGLTVPYANSLSELKDAKQDSQFIDGDDLVFKMMNRGSGIHGKYIHFVDATANQNPNLLFSTPVNDQVFNNTDKIYVLVNATDNDGSVANVKLFLEGIEVRQENMAPYEWNAPSQNDSALSNLSPGTYELLAIVTDNDGAETRESINIIVEDATLSSNANLTITSVKIYPNPVGAHQKITLNNPNKINLREFSIYDLTGRRVLKYDLEEAASNYNFNISHLASGNYLVVIKSLNRSVVKRLIKQ